MSNLDQNKNEKLFGNILENKNEKLFGNILENKNEKLFGNILENKNEKVFESFDEETFSELDDESEDTEIQRLHNVKLMNVPMIDRPEFEINRFFNELPIRILNSHEMPFFYAEDVAKALGIKNTKTTTQNFDEDEIVSMQQRQKYNITTYKKYRNTFRPNNKIILLTEFGVYRLLLSNRSEKSNEFKKFLYDVLHQLRTVGEYKIKAELEQLKTINETHLAKIGTLTQALELKDKKISQFKNMCDEIVLLEFPNDPHVVYQTNVSSKLRKKSDKYSEHNKIDNPVPIALFLADDLGIILEFHSMVECHYSQRKTLHAENVIKAHQFICDNTPRFSYLVTPKPTPEQLSAGNVVHRVYVNDTQIAMKKLSKLTDFKPVNASKSANWYSCDKEKIINAMNAIVAD